MRFSRALERHWPSISAAQWRRVYTAIAVICTAGRRFAGSDRSLEQGTGPMCGGDGRRALLAVVRCARGEDVAEEVTTAKRSRQVQIERRDQTGEGFALCTRWRFAGDFADLDCFFSDDGFGKDQTSLEISPRSGYFGAGLARPRRGRSWNACLPGGRQAQR